MIMFIHTWALVAAVNAASGILDRIWQVCSLSIHHELGGKSHNTKKPLIFTATLAVLREVRAQSTISLGETDKIIFGLA